MTTETVFQQSAIIEWQNPKDLKAHRLNQAIYGDDGYQDLVDSVKELGVLEAIYCLKDNTIVSGHRRWRAAVAAGLTSVPTGKRRGIICRINGINHNTGT